MFGDFTSGSPKHASRAQRSSEMMWRTLSVSADGEEPASAKRNDASSASGRIFIGGGEKRPMPRFHFNSTSMRELPRRMEALARAHRTSRAECPPRAPWSFRNLLRAEVFEQAGEGGLEGIVLLPVREVGLKYSRCSAAEARCTGQAAAGKWASDPC